MRASYWPALLWVLALGTSPLGAGPIDLARIDRTLAKEPEYQSKAPRYGLLVFGAEAKSRVWVVLDGDVLYIDRNGNGDITERAKRVRAEATPTREKGARAELRRFKVGDLTESDGKTRHTSVEVGHYREDGRVLIQVAVAGRGLQYAGWGTQGDLHFAERPRDAPIVHFGGPLTMRVSREPKRGAREPQLVLREAADTLYAEVGTPGQGPGTFACLALGAIPNHLVPVCTIAWPRARGVGPRVRDQVVLAFRC